MKLQRAFCYTHVNSRVNWRDCFFFFDGKQIKSRQATYERLNYVFLFAPLCARYTQIGNYAGVASFRDIVKFCLHRKLLRSFHMYTDKYNRDFWVFKDKYVHHAE